SPMSISMSRSWGGHENRADAGRRACPRLATLLRAQSLRAPLRELIESGAISADAPITLDENGAPVTGAEVLESLKSNGELAHPFVESAVRSVVLSLVGQKP